MSSASPTILLTFTPCSGRSSYRVTDGPQLMLVTVTPTPKFFRVCWSLIAVSLYSCSENAPAGLLPLFNRVTGGNWYSFFTISRSLIWAATPRASSPCSSRTSLRRLSTFFFNSSVSLSMIFPEAVTTRLLSSGIRKSSGSSKSSSCEDVSSRPKEESSLSNTEPPPPMRSSAPAFGTRRILSSLSSGTQWVMLSGMGSSP